MDKKMNYNLILSLKEICFRKVVVVLWTQRYNLASFYEYSDKNVVIGLMRKLELPPLLTEQMTYLIEPIQTEIKKWIYAHTTYSSHHSLDPSILQKLYWTNLGTVDYRKSAEKLICDEMFDIVICYELACLYCLEDHISVLWEKLPEENKRRFYEDGDLQITKPQLQFCWPYILNGESTKLDNMPGRSIGEPTTFNQYAFEYSAYGSNKAATEYFFLKLTNAEIEVSLFKSTKAVIMRQSENVFSFDRLCDISCYLLSLLNSEQQMEIFKEYPFTILRIFLEWPRQDLSLDIAELIWPFLTANEYANALWNISWKISLGFNLGQSFQELFLHGSSNFRDYFVSKECEDNVCFHSFFKVQDSETIKTIFRAVDSLDRKRLVFSKRMLKNFHKSILRGEVHVVESCLLEATLSKKDKETLKEAFFILLTKIRNDRRNFSRNINNFMVPFIKIKNEEGKEVIFEPLTDTDLETRNSNRRECVREQFFHIVDEGEAKISITKSIDEMNISYPSWDSDNEDDF